VLVVRAGQAIEEFPLGYVGDVVLDFTFLEAPGYACGLWDEFADVAPIRIERFIFVKEHIFQFEADGFV
jgi:hypothetical protein